MSVLLSQRNDSPNRLAVDRQKSVPFLLRIFFNFEIHNPLSEYNQIDRLPENELQVYTWRDATLHELAQLIKEVLPEAREPGVSMQFNLIYPDALRGRYSVTTLSSVHNDRTGPGDNRTLADCRLVIGDFIDVSIVPAQPHRSIRSGAANNRGRGGRPRDHDRARSGWNGDRYGHRDASPSRRSPKKPRYND